jgi:hypothetical protein
VAAPDERRRSDDVERYEQLRHRAIEGDASGWRLGLALLQRRGVTAWCRAWEPTPAPSPAGPPAAAPTGGDEIVGVLATMALACLGRR